MTRSNVSSYTEYICYTSHSPKLNTNGSWQQPSKKCVTFISQCIQNSLYMENTFILTCPSAALFLDKDSWLLLTSLWLADQVEWKGGVCVVCTHSQHPEISKIWLISGQTLLHKYEAFKFSHKLSASLWGRCVHIFSCVI